MHLCIRFSRRTDVNFKGSDIRYVVTIMKVSLEDIRAWVDGELDELHAYDVAVAVIADTELMQIADTMRASLLPYREAYEHAAVADIPQSLLINIETLKNPPPVSMEKGSSKNSDSFGFAVSVILAVLIGFLVGTSIGTQVLVDAWVGTLNRIVMLLLS